MKKIFISFIATFLLSIPSFGQKLVAEVKSGDANYKILDKFASKYNGSKLLYNIMPDANLKVDEKSDGKNTIVTDQYKNTITIEVLSQTANSIKFNVVGYGKTVSNLTYTSVEDIRGKGCWICIPIIIEVLAEILLDSGGASGICTAGINACVQSGGLPQITVTNTPNGPNCIVKCLKN